MSTPCAKAFTSPVPLIFLDVTGLPCIRYDYGLQLVLLSVDEGITGYRDDSLETVKRNQEDYGLPLKVVSYEELYGWTMDAIVRQIGV